MPDTPLGPEVTEVNEGGSCSWRVCTVAARWVTMCKALWEHRKEKLRSALEHGRSRSDRNRADPPAPTKCLIGRDRELWQREWGPCFERLENCGQGIWMAGVEKAESLLGERACGFSPAGHRGNSCSYPDARSTALVNDGWINWLINGCMKWMEVLKWGRGNWSQEASKVEGQLVRGR